MADLARTLGVSKSTVSRAFSHPNQLGADTVARVVRTAARIGYSPNRAARALSTGRHGIIAMVVPDIANPYFPPMIRAAQAEADQSDLCVFLGNSDEDPVQEDRLLTRFLSQVEGVLLISPRLDEARIRAHAARCPLVLVNRDISGIPRVLVDSGPAVAEAVAHLHGLGHRHIVYAAGPGGSWSDGERRRAARTAAQRLDVALTILPVTKPTFETGRALAGPVVQTGASAAIAFDDITAHGLLAGLRDLGFAVPGDFSLVGCDDVLGVRTNPPLTTVSTSSEEAGRAAVALLLDRLGQPPGADHDIRTTLPSRLILRRTTGPVPLDHPETSRC